MASIEINGLLISRNHKTGLSINVDQCTPTKLCIQFCYRRWRTIEDIRRRGWTSTPNTGPITWRTQREAYKRNEEVIKELKATGRLEETAALIAQRCARLGVGELRGNGTGDLFDELTELYVLLGWHGLPVYLFSRRVEQIVALARLSDDFLLSITRPFVLGSVDPSTPLADVDRLARATALVNGQPALAYATMTAGEAGCREVDAHPYHEVIHVVFGYHSNTTKTVLGHERECPATAGRKITCRDCRRCMRA